MNFLDYIKDGDASKATALIETALKQKTLHFIKEQRAAVAEATYGDEELTEGKESSFKDFHKAATDAGYAHTPPKQPTSPAYHNYNHPNGHAMMVSVNTKGPTGPYGAQKKGNVNAFNHVSSSDKSEGGFTVNDFKKVHQKAEESHGKK
jgi:hypothetical protein